MVGIEEKVRIHIFIETNENIMMVLYDLFLTFFIKKWSTDYIIDLCV